MAPIRTCTRAILTTFLSAALGNVVGGGLFVGAVYWYLYLTGPGSDNIGFDLSGLDTAMEAGGPMGSSFSRSVTKRQTSEYEKNAKVINGREPEEGHPNHVSSLPSSGQHMASGIGRELSADMYTQRKEEMTSIEGQSA